MDQFPVGAGEALGVLVEDDLGQVLAKDRRVTGTPGMHLGQVHDLHLAVVTQEAATLALAREADAPGDVLVQVAQHHQRLDQEHRLGGLVLHQAQVLADPARRAVACFTLEAVLVVVLIEEEGAGVVYQFRHVQGDVRAAAAQANQAHRRELLLQAQLVLVLHVQVRRKHQVAQAVEVVEDALDVLLGEVQVLLRRHAAGGGKVSSTAGSQRSGAEGRLGDRIGRSVRRGHSAPFAWSGWLPGDACHLAITEKFRDFISASFSYAIGGFLSRTKVFPFAPALHRPFVTLL